MCFCLFIRCPCTCVLFVQYIPAPFDLAEHLLRHACARLDSTRRLKTCTSDGNDNDMPPRGGTTAWTSERIGIRPPPHKPPAQKSEKGKGRAKTPEPARSPAIRKLDELLAGLRSSSSRQITSTPDAGCFCQGASVLAPTFFFQRPSDPSSHTYTYQHAYTSPQNIHPSARHAV